MDIAQEIVAVVLEEVNGYSPDEARAAALDYNDSLEDRIRRILKEDDEEEEKKGSDAILPALPDRPGRFLTRPDGYTVWVPDETDLKNVATMAKLRYSLSAISVALGAPIGELRRYMADPGSPVHKAYHAGKLSFDVGYRITVKAKAEAGEEWAVILIDKWEREQRKEEMGFGM